MKNSLFEQRQEIEHGLLSFQIVATKVSVELWSKSVTLSFNGSMFFISHLWAVYST